MSKAAKTRCMPDIAVSLVIIVAVQFPVRQLFSTSGAKIPVFAQAMHSHHHILEPRTWV